MFQFQVAWVTDEHDNSLILVDNVNGLGTDSCENRGSCMNWIFNLRFVGLIQDDVQLSLFEGVQVSTLLVRAEG